MREKMREKRPVSAVWWHALSNYCVEVKPVQVAAYTDHSVTIIENEYELRRARLSSYGSFFPTFDEVKAFYVELATERLALARRDLEKAQKMMENAKGLEPPPQIEG